MNKKVQEALTAFANRKMKVDIPQLPINVYIRPIQYEAFFSVCAESLGETDEEREEIIDIALSAYSMVDENGEQIFNADEYKDWISKVDYKTALAIVKARNTLSDFNGLDSEDKKKL